MITKNKTITAIVFALLTLLVPQMASTAAASTLARTLYGPLAQLNGCPAGTVGGTIFRDYNANGVYDAPLGGNSQAAADGLLSGVEAPITISAYGPGGGLLATTTQDVNGDYNLGAINTAGGVRLEFTGLPDWVQPGPYGIGAPPSSGTLVQFINAPTCNVDLAVNNPADYCEANPEIATSCLINGDSQAGGTVGQAKSLLAWSYDENGWWYDYPDPDPNVNVPPPPPTAEEPAELAISSQTGAIWGIAYERETQTIFSSALMKRHVSFGPLGPGGIYATDYSNPAAPVVSNYVDLAALGVNVGADPHGTLPADINTDFDLVSSIDADSFDAVGKIGLGDLDLSEDGSTLYAISLASKELIAIDVASQTIAAQIAIPNPGCVDSTEGIEPAPQDARPWALKAHDGELYVGVTCSAQTSQLREDLHAYILRLENGSLISHFDFPLDFTKGRVSTHLPDLTEDEIEFDIIQARGWMPWTADFEQTIINPDYATGNIGEEQTLVYPQPILSDIEVADNGDLILGFIDRLGHQGGRKNRSTDPNDARLYNVHSGGDILRACNVNGELFIEGDPDAGLACENVPEDGEPEPQGPNGGEHYFEDDFNTVVGDGGLMHNETTLGALTLRPGSGEVVSTHFDAVRHYDPSLPESFPRTGGVRFFRNASGEYSLVLDADGNPIENAFRAYEVFPDTEVLPGSFAKAAGLGDLELLCDSAPVEVGNYVWLDSDADGIQDPNETPIPGVVVEILGPAGNVIGTATTDANGQYYFSSDSTRQAESTASAVYGVPNLLPNVDGYRVRVLLAQTALAGVAPTAPNATGDTTNNNKTDLIDSDGITNPGFSTVFFATGVAGANNHNMDFGFTAGVVDIFDLALRKTLAAEQPEVVIPGALVNFTITVFNQGTLTATNIQVTDYLDTIWTLSDPDWTLSGNLATTILPGPLAPGASTTVDITLQLTAAATPGEYINFAEISQGNDEEGVPRVDIDSTPDQDVTNDCNPVDDEITGDAKTNPCTEDEDDHDFAVVRVPTMSLGNRVWLDNGSPDGTSGIVNNGVQEASEVGIANVQLSLLDGDGNPVLDASSQPMVATTQAEGYYLFDNLAPGDYIVCVDADNFVGGNPLADLRSSTPTEEDPNDDVDQNDNGFNETDPATTGICSGIATLAFGTEPTDDTDLGPAGAGSARNIDSNLTVDFGFIPVDLASIFDLALRKTLAAGQERLVIPGELVTFAIEVFNQGQITAVDITVVDYIPDGLTLEDARWTGTDEIVSQTIPGPLNPGESTVIDIVFRVNADVPPGEIVNLAEISRTFEPGGSEPEDRDSTPNDNPNDDCNPKDNVIDEDGKNNPCDEDEDDHDPEPVRVPSMSLGNRVWIDDGAGGGGANNGILDGSEQGVAGVKLNLVDENLTPILDEDGMPRMTTTIDDGYYLFDDLSPGQYVVCVDASNFEPDAPLEDLLSSGPTEENPNDNVDLNDNGINDTNPEANGVCSSVVSALTLIYFEEPVLEPDQGLAGSGAASDNNSNITVDFGFVRTPTALDEGEEPVLQLDNRIFIPMLMQP